MNNLGSRIEKLEKQTGASNTEQVTLVVVYDDTGKPSEAALEAATVDYKAKLLDWQEQAFNVIWVIRTEAKELTERIIAGERT